MSEFDYGEIWDRELLHNGLSLVHTEVGARGRVMGPDVIVECIGHSALKLARCRIPSQIKPGDIVLEIGCGPGFNLAAIGAGRIQEHCLYGIDPSKEMIELGAGVTRGMGSILLMHGRLQDIGAIMPGVPKFDVVYECIVFQHLRKAEVQRIFHQVRRLLSSTGRFVFQLLRADSPAVRPWDGPEDERPVPCMRGYEPDEVSAMLKDAGFNAERMTSWTVDEHWFVVRQEA